MDVPWREGELEQAGGTAALAVQDDRFALAQEGHEVVVGPWNPDLATRLRDAALVVHDAKAARLEAGDDTLLMAYLIDPGRSSYPLDDLAAEYGVELVPQPATDDETAALVRRAAATLRLEPQLRARIAERGLEPLYRTVELPLSAVLAAMEDVGVRIDTYRMGEITARLAERVEELEARAHELAGEEFMLGSTQQVARILFEVLGLTAGRKGKTGYSTDARVLRSIRSDHEIVGVIEEWREYSKLLNTYLEPFPSLISPDDGRLHTTLQPGGRLDRASLDLEPEPPGDSDPHRARS